MTLLAVESLEAAYGPVQALFGVDLDVDEGEVVALLGRNGMGKTTTIRVICRLLRERGGRLSFAGRDLAALAPHRAARAGLGLVPEGRRCFGNLSVRENLLVAARPGHWNLARIGALFPRLAEREGQSADSLSGGEQQMLAIGRALATNPRLLVLDEATEGLAPRLRREVGDAVATLGRESGLAILVVDKSLAELRRYVDRAVILERGRSVWAERLDALTPDLAARYLGV